MKKVLTLLCFLTLFLAGCSIEVETKKGCDRYRDSFGEDCRWCESNGGHYFNKSSWSSECLFVPKKE